MSARDDKAKLNIQIHSTVPRSSQLLSCPPFLPSIPLFLSVSPLPHATFSPPFFSFSTFSTSSSSCQAFVLLFCFDTFLKHVEEREEAKTEGERMERRRKKEGGLVSEKVRD